MERTRITGNTERMSKTTARKTTVTHMFGENTLKTKKKTVKRHLKM